METISDYLYTHEDPRQYVDISYSILDRLLRIIEDDCNPANYFLENEIRTIAIYGMGNLGGHFYRILKKGGLDIAYGIDENADNIFDAPINVYLPMEGLAPVDAILVTPVKYFYSIERKLNAIFKGLPIVSAETIVDFRCIAEN